MVGLILEFLKLDQLCLMNQEESLFKVLKGEFKEVLEIPPEELNEWEQRNTGIDGDSAQADRRLLFLQLFVSLGDKNQVRRVFEKWGYKESINRIPQWPKGNSVLIQASILGREEMISLLIDFGANINHANPRGWTAVHTAVYYNQLTVVEILLENDVDCGLITAEGYRLLGLAQRMKREDPREEMKQRAIEKLLRRKIQ